MRDQLHAWPGREPSSLQEIRARRTGGGLHPDLADHLILKVLDSWVATKRAIGALPEVLAPGSVILGAGSQA